MVYLTTRLVLTSNSPELVKDVFVNVLCCYWAACHRWGGAEAKLSRGPSGLSMSSFFLRRLNATWCLPLLRVCPFKNVLKKDVHEKAILHLLSATSIES